MKTLPHQELNLWPVGYEASTLDRPKVGLPDKCIKLQLDFHNNQPYSQNGEIPSLVNFTSDGSTYHIKILKI